MPPAAANMLLEWSVHFGRYSLEEIAGGGTQDNGAWILCGPHKGIWQAEGQEQEAWPAPV